MRLFPQGVTVVTTEAEGGPKGMTVSSFISVSLEPPLVLVSIGKVAEAHDSFVKADSFAVNFLAEDQGAVSDLFAGRTGVKDIFGAVKFHRGKTGSPILDGARAVIECRKWRVVDAGDHSMVLGEVVSTSMGDDERPLVYYAQRYTTIEKEEQQARSLEKTE